MDSQKQIIVRVLKKISALRATLRDDERNFLDGLILGPIDATASDEVSGHQFKPAGNPRNDPAPDEVSAHQFKPAGSPRNDPAPDEVSAHQYKPAGNPRNDPAPDEVSAHEFRPARPVTIVLENGEYKLS